jgi:hypothetical protein
MTADAPPVAVAYLLRKGNPPHLFEAFLDSLARHPPGMDYRPVLIQKGFEPDFAHPLAARWASQERPAEIVDVADAGFALTAFRDAAVAIDAPRQLFLTSYSRVLADDWLAKLVRAADDLGAGSLVGASGSWESLGPTTPFPNTTLRSNAFLIERDIFLAYPHPLDGRYDGNLFEAGPDSITHRTLTAGGRIAVVDRDGRAWSPSDWPDSRTFRSYNQEALLIADNRTVDYQCVSLRRRTRRAALAFGDRARIVPQNIFSRWHTRLAWRRGWRLPEPPTG